MSSEHDEAKLKLALAGMLPKKIIVNPAGLFGFFWNDKTSAILDTEWLHVCHLVEQTLSEEERLSYLDELGECYGGRYVFEWVNSPWPLRAHALCIVKGVEV